MQTPIMIIAAFLLAFTAGCKGKKDVADAATSNSATQAKEQVVTSPAVVEEVQQPMEEPTYASKLGEDSVFFSLERTPCFGTCPTFKITIFQDGSAIYDGRRFAPREGIYTGSVDAATMKALAEEAEARGFYAMDDVYDRPVTDLPSVIIRVHADARDKQVVGRVGPPQAFKNFTQRAEELLANIEWTKVEVEPR